MNKLEYLLWDEDSLLRCKVCGGVVDMGTQGSRGEWVLLTCRSCRVTRIEETGDLYANVEFWE